MPYTQTVWVDNTTLVDAAKMNKIEAGIASLSAPAPSTTPPASPADGDIWYFPADATNGVTWQFRYNAGGSTYRWEFVGGPVLFNEVAADETYSSATPGDCATPGPQLTAPRAGQYQISFGFNGYHATAGTNVQGGIATSSIAVTVDISLMVTASNAAVQTSRTRVISCNAGDLVKLQYASSAASGHFRWRFLTLVPVRVS